MPGTIHVSPELATRAEALFQELGLDLDTAVSLFLRQALQDQGLPFTPRLIPAPSSTSGTESTPAEQPVSPSATLPNEERSVPPAEPADALERTDDTQNDGPEMQELQPDSEVDMPSEPAATETEKVESLQDNDAYREPSAFFNDAPADDTHSLSELRQAFLDMHLIGTPLRRVRSLNRLYAIGEANEHVPGWREVYVSGDEPFALDFGVVRVELGYHGGGSLRMMDGRLPDEVLEADAVFPRDLSAVFSSVIGQRLTDVSSGRVPGGEAEQLRLRFANGCTLIFMPGAEWGALWLTDAHGSVLYAPDTVWLRVLGERMWQGLR
ncbi:MAG: hypothetical protein IKJ34_05720 [Mailhella sp.]|nr:hypothetical protein [Mailhella sp.]